MMGRATQYNKLTSPEQIAKVNPNNKALQDDYLDYLKSVHRSKGTIVGYKNDLEIFWVWVMENLDNKDFQTILVALAKIIERGALERFFRMEGKMNDDVYALSLDSHKLRLYCLRISDQILILGNGGVKDTRTYQDDETLSGYVMDLQRFDKLLKQAQKKGNITIEKNYIIGLEGATFEL